MVCLCSCTLFLCKLGETFTVNGDSSFLADFYCKIYRETICVGKLERVIARQNILSFLCKIICERIEKLCTLVDRLGKRLLLYADYLLDVFSLFSKFGIC